MKETTRKALAYYHAARIIEEMFDSDQFDPDLEALGASISDVRSFDEAMQKIIFDLKWEAKSLDPTLFTVREKDNA